MVHMPVYHEMWYGCHVFASLNFWSWIINIVTIQIWEKERLSWSDLVGEQSFYGEAIRIYIISAA